MTSTAPCCHGTRCYEQVEVPYVHPKAEVVLQNGTRCNSGPLAPSSTLGLLQALSHLQRELEPVMANVCHAESRTLLQALEAENVALRKRVRELERGFFGERTAADPKAKPLLLSEHSDPPVNVMVPSSAGDCKPELKMNQEGTQSREDDLELDTDSPSDLPGAGGIVHNNGEVEAKAQVCMVEYDDASIYASMADAPLDSFHDDPMTKKGRASESFAHINAPQRAFVINVRRLVEAQEGLELLHELIQNLAMAALTLCSAGSPEQLCGTCCFLVFIILIFVLHGRVWDTLDVKDLSTLLPVIADDEDKGPNPNRLLKALTFSQSQLLHVGRQLLDLTLAFVCITGWLILRRAWNTSRGIDLQDPAENDAIDAASRFVVADGTHEDVLVLGTQVGVMTLMFILNFLFDAMYYNETCAVMPPTLMGSTWDPRVNGVPWRFWLFGLPSMWFTSADVLGDLKHYIHKANLIKRVLHICPQEIAYYALSGFDELHACKRTLRHARLFDGRTRKLIGDELNIDLCFFDSMLHTQGCPHPGEFLSLIDEDDSNISARPKSVLQIASSRTSMPTH